MRILQLIGPVYLNLIPPPFLEKYLMKKKGGHSRLNVTILIKLPKNTFKKDPIPERYNTKSELKKEVVDGKNNFDFELTSK